MPLTKSAAILQKNPCVVTSPRGVEAWGLYWETVEVYPSGAVSWYNRAFLAGSTISYFHRPADASRTTWKLYRYPTVEKAEAKALELMQTASSRSMNVIMRGAPILVQLEPVDVAAIADKAMPGARYRGNNKHESTFGKLETGAIVKPATLSQVGFEALKLAAAAKAATGTPAPPTPTSPSGEPY
jgi:hypothetical protein